MAGLTGVVVTWVVVPDEMGLKLTESVPVSLARFSSPPPETVAVSVSGAVADAEMSTPTVITGRNEFPGGRSALLVHVSVARVQNQPVPLIDVAVSPGASVKATVTGAVVPASVVF